jgi:hypothetical protein
VQKTITGIPEPVVTALANEKLNVKAQQDRKIKNTRQWRYIKN